MGEDSACVSPRSYNLGDGVQRDEFIDDFKITAAINLIKLSVMSYLRTTGTSSIALDITNINIDNSILDDAVLACSRFIGLDCVDECADISEKREKQTRKPLLRAHSDLSVQPDSKPTNRSSSDIRLCKFSSSSSSIFSTSTPSDCGVSEGPIPKAGYVVQAATFADVQLCHSVFGLTETQWDRLLDKSYELVEALDQVSEGTVSVESERALCSFRDCLRCSRGGSFAASCRRLLSFEPDRCCRFQSLPSHILQLVLLLDNISRQRKQYFIDGCRNIWVVKAPDVSRGVGVQVSGIRNIPCCLSLIFASL